MLLLPLLWRRIDTMKRSSDDIEATTKGEEPRLEIDDSASACF